MVSFSFWALFRTIPGSGFFHLLYLEFSSHFALNHIFLPSRFSWLYPALTLKFITTFSQIAVHPVNPQGSSLQLWRSTDKCELPSWLSITRGLLAPTGAVPVWAANSIHSFIASFPAAFPGLEPDAIWRHGSDQEHNVLAPGQKFHRGKKPATSRNLSACLGRGSLENEAEGKSAENSMNYVRPNIWLLLFCTALSQVTTPQHQSY